MTQFEIAMLDIKNHAGRLLKTPLDERSAVLAITAMMEMQRNQKMRCENCTFFEKENISCCYYGDEVSADIPVEKAHFCSYFEEKE